MSYYGGTVTVAGRNLITSLMAGKTIEFTRIMVGSGAMPEGVEPIDMVTLVTPVAEGVSSVPTVENGVLSMVVEYRNDLNGGHFSTCVHFLSPPGFQIFDQIHHRTLRGIPYTAGYQLLDVPLPLSIGEPFKKHHIPDKFRIVH